MGCGYSKRKHTPIVSKAQRGKFGAELRRRRKGLKSRMEGITTKELESHLSESRGKQLPYRRSTSYIKSIGRKRIKRGYV